MIRINKDFFDLPAANAEAYVLEIIACRRWQNLCERYLPVKKEDSIWRYNRQTRAEEPLQGWKLHISAAIFEACDLFEKVVPFLLSQNLQFKAPASLNELSKINSGLQYGYPQTGKFITIYPSTEKQAVKIARELHELTREFIAVKIPFDAQLEPKSSVFYRYGAFALMEIFDENGAKQLAVKDSRGKFVADNRMEAVPGWLTDPFQSEYQKREKPSTPLTSDYKVFRAITQRGKGGVYHALDLSGSNPRFCVVKEGRRHGEAGWNGQDGYFLVKNEFNVLSILGKSNKNVPQVFSSFEIEDDFYLVMEFIEGESLHNVIKTRRRRLSIGRVLKLAVEIAAIVGEVHAEGWIWNDCKPSNLIICEDNKLRPIDFEGAYRIGENGKFDWRTKSFSKDNSERSKAVDLYAVGAVLYFLLTGKFYDAEKPVKISRLRRDVPRKLVEII